MATDIGFIYDVIRVVNEGQETVVLFCAIFSTATELLLCQRRTERYMAIGILARHFKYRCIDA